jgi:hypothetical protein
VNIVKVDVDNPTELLAAYGAGAKVRLEYSVTGDGSGFAEVGSQTIVAGTLRYVFNHAGGATGGYYRARYSDVAGTLLSDYSPEWREAPALLYASVDELAARLPSLPAGGARSSDRLESALADATAEITALCERDFFSHPDETRLFSVPRRRPSSRLVIIDGFYRIAQIRWASQTGANDWTTLDPSAYFIRPAQREPEDTYYIIELNGVTGPIGHWYSGEDVVEITGDFGFPAVPSIIKRGTLALARQMWNASATASGQAAQDPDFAGSIIPSSYPKLTWDAIVWGRNRLKYETI